MCNRTKINIFCKRMEHQFDSEWDSCSFITGLLDSCAVTSSPIQLLHTTSAVRYTRDHYTKAFIWSGDYDAVSFFKQFKALRLSVSRGKSVRSAFEVVKEVSQRCLTLHFSLSDNSTPVRSTMVEWSNLPWPCCNLFNHCST